ncbi:MAG: SDR family NAD(P)-dependent oxidoreductase, partial [Terriglobia bacterium]
MTDAPSQQTALVTGAARRIGRVIARDLAAHGWRIAIHYRSSREEAEGLAAEIRAAGGTAAALAANLANIEEVRSLIARCSDALGPPTCLVN